MGGKIILLFYAPLEITLDDVEKFIHCIKVSAMSGKGLNNNILILSSLLLFSFPLSAQNADTLMKLNFEVQNSISKLIRKVQNGEIKGQEEVSLLADSALSAAVKLNSSSNELFASVGSFAGSSENNLRMISAIAEASNTLKSSTVDSISPRDVLVQNLIAKDFFAKARTYSFNVGASSPSLVEVKVETQEGNTKIAGYEVHCNYLWEFDNPVPRFISSSPTNDAVLLLTPGWYYFWIVDDGDVKAKKFRVGRKGDSELLTILLR